MNNYVVDCQSGAECLVRASSLTRAQREWNHLVERGDAEPGTVRHPRRGEVRQVARHEGGMHDYR